jgi:hypothetical protein
MLASPGKIISQFQISHLHVEAHGRAATVSTAMDVLQRSIIRPLNSEVFQGEQLCTFKFKTLIVNNGGNSKKPHKCDEERLTSSQRAQTVNINRESKKISS